MAVKSKPIVAFGGTFDPIHNGHIAVARALRDDLNPEIVLLIPAGRPWLRSDAPMASAETRMKLVQLTVLNEKDIEACDVDIVREGDTHSIDTIADLRDRYGRGRDFILALGADSANTISKWHQHEKLLNMCKVAIVERHGINLDLSNNIFKEAITVIGPLSNISASDVRAAYRQGELTRARAMVPAKVHDHIVRERIY